MNHRSIYNVYYTSLDVKFHADFGLEVKKCFCLRSPMSKRRSITGSILFIPDLAVEEIYSHVPDFG